MKFIGDKVRSDAIRETMSKMAAVPPPDAADPESERRTADMQKLLTEHMVEVASEEVASDPQP